MQLSAIATALSAGTYSVVVADANGCTQETTVIITEPSAVTAIGSTITNVSCFNGNNGSATVNPGGGILPYTYQWSPTGGNAVTANGLALGAYTVTVTDANGCSTTSTACITEPTAVTASGSNVANVSSFGGNDGSTTVIPGGGTAPYSYQWSPTGGNSITANNLSAGTYSITVTDATGCSVISSASVSQPSLLTAAASPVSNVSFHCSSCCTLVIVNNLIPGTYTITVTYANCCSTTSTATITQPAVVTANITNSSNVTCNGGNNGTATVTAGGGTGTYTYAWNTNPMQLSAIATALSAGTYSVVVADANGCTQVTTVIITEPSAVTAIGSTITNVSCFNGNNGSATVNPGSGFFFFFFL